MSVIPEQLLKDELVFEIRLRGGTPVGKTEDLRKQLRGLVNSGAESVWSGNLDVDEELKICKGKLEDWESSADDWRKEMPSGREKGRLVARLTHLLTRLKFLSAETSLPASELVQLGEGIVMLEELRGLLAAEGRAGVPSESE